jgi:excisionase family DNA binding protein
MTKAKEVPIWEKTTLTLEEAATYTGVGINKLRDISNDERCPFVLWNGTKRLLKRKQLEDYLAKSYSI